MKLRILYTSLCIFILVSCTRHYRKQQQEFSHHAFAAANEQAAAAAVIAGYRQNLERETKKILGTAQEALSRNGDQSTLGNFVCDAMRFAADSLFKGVEADLVIANRGGLRADLPKGEISAAVVYELMPFDNDLVLVSVTGKALAGFLPLFEQKRHAFYGAKISMTGEHVTGFLIGNAALDSSKVYRVLTNDFVANGGDNFMFLTTPLASIHSTTKVRQAIMDYCLYLTRQKLQIIPYTDARLVSTK